MSKAATMSVKADSQARVNGATTQDKVKWTAAVLLLLGGLAGFYYLSERSLFLAWVSVLAGSVMAVVLAYHTEQGREIAGFLKEAQIEVRKVVWPTRAETVQTTIAVLVVVVVVGVGLWLLDQFLGWLVQQLTFGGS
ncbi:MAG TPA: preprotein translocase subunit SecE [Gammaproteobacteria bacterium]|nr:preprotein translocase subunit SecE [Gammaproteobacteria bacterium]